MYQNNFVFRLSFFQRYTYYRGRPVKESRERPSIVRKSSFSVLKHLYGLVTKNILNWKPDIYVSSSISPRELYVSFISILILFDFSLILKQKYKNHLSRSNLTFRVKSVTWLSTWTESVQVANFLKKICLYNVSGDVLDFIRKLL